MTLLALGAKCGFLAARGLTNLLVPSSATACDARKPSSPSSADRATAVNPPPDSQRNSRRVRPQKSVMSCSALLAFRARLDSASAKCKRLIQIDEFVQVQGQQTQGPERFFGTHPLHEGQAAFDLRSRRLSLERPPQSETHLCG